MRAGADETIETAHLVLRPPRVEDFDAFAALWADPEATRFVGGRPLSRAEAWTRFLRQAGHWYHTGFGFFAVVDRADGAFLGEAGFHDLKREITPSLEGTLETGWILSPAVAGRGLASEAVAALIGWAGRRHPARRLTCLIERDHARSIRVAEKNGFRPFAETTYGGRPVILFERTA